MRSKRKSSLLVPILLSILLTATLLTNIAIAQTVPGTPDDTTGVWLYSAGTDVPGGAPTDDIIDSAVYYDILDFIGDTAAEVYDFGYGPSEPVPGHEDTTVAEVIEGLLAIDDFGYIDEAEVEEDLKNFDTGRLGFFEGGFDPATGQRIYPDGTAATGILGPNGATNETEAEAALDGCEIFIFEDAELSGMNITLSNSLGLNIVIVIEHLQVNPPTPNGADDTLIAIDLDTLEGFDGTFIDTIRIQDDGITSPSMYGDTTVEIDAIATRKSLLECTVYFYTDPTDIGYITVDNKTYWNGDYDVWNYCDTFTAVAHAPAGWVFVRWEVMGNIDVLEEVENTIRVHISCGGSIKAYFKPIECTVYFYTDPTDIGYITVDNKTYWNGDYDVWNYCTTLTAIANAPAGYVFDRWEVTGNLDVLEEIDNTIRFHIACGGTVKAYFTHPRAKITGGGHGYIRAQRGLNWLPGGSFGFNVMWFSKDPGPKGELNYVDHTTGMHVHAHVIEYLSVWEVSVGNKPWPLRKGIFGGPCTINGEDGYTFEVYIEDNGEPGRNDVFQITLSTGYVGGSDVEPILCGNIQIHKPPK